MNETAPSHDGAVFFCPLACHSIQANVRGVPRPTPFLASLLLTLLAGACSTFGSANGDTPDGGSTGNTPEGGAGTLDGGYPPLRVTLVSPIAPVVRGRAPIVAEVKVEPLGVDAEVLVDGLPPGSPKTFAGVNRATGIAKIPIEVPAGTKPGEYPVVLRATSAGTPSKGDLSAKLTIVGAPGELDETFGTNGRVLEPVDNFSVNDATLVSNQVVLGGKDDTGPLLRRFNLDGTRDTTFGDQGTFRVAGPVLGDAFYQVAAAPDGLRAIFGSYSETTVYRVDGAGVLSVVRKLPRADFSEATSVSISASNRMVLTGSRNNTHWTLAALDATTGAPSSWGTSGFVHEAAGSSASAFAFFEDTGTDHAFVQSITPPSLFDVTLDKTGGVLEKTTIPGLDSTPRSVLRLGANDYLMLKRDHSLLRWKAGVATPFGETIPGVSPGAATTPKPFVRRRSGGFLVLAPGSEEIPGQLTGPLFLKLCMLTEEGKVVTSFGIAGCQKVALDPQSTQPGHRGVAVFVSDDDRRATIFGVVSVSLGNYRVGMTRMWL